MIIAIVACVGCQQTMSVQQVAKLVSPQQLLEGGKRRVTLIYDRSDNEYHYFRASYGMMDETMIRVNQEELDISIPLSGATKESVPINSVQGNPAILLKLDGERDAERCESEGKKVLRHVDPLGRETYWLAVKDDRGIELK